MAVEMFVLSDRKLGSIAEWQAAIGAQKFPLVLDGNTDLDAQSGFLPTRLDGTLTGFECDYGPADEFMRANPEIDFGHDWKFALAFRWIGDFNEMLAAWMAASSYAAATTGVVLDGEELRIFSAADAIEEARYLQADMPRLEAIARELRKS